MRVAIPIFDGVTGLDAVGPYEILSRAPGVEVTFTSHEPGLVRTEDGMLAIRADAAFDDLPDPDLLVVPGGFGTRRLMADDQVLNWLRRAHETTAWTTSVCTGALLLGAAGLLAGISATTHWRAFDTLASTGALPTAQRIVSHQRIITAAGVSAGIDMAVHLAGQIAGDAVAQAIQLSIEYDPERPYDAGSLQKAPADVVRLARNLRPGADTSPIDTRTARV